MKRATKTPAVADDGSIAITSTQVKQLNQLLNEILQQLILNNRLLAEIGK